MSDEKRDEVETVQLARGATPGTLSIAGAAAREAADEPELAFDTTTDRFEEHAELGRGGMGRVVDVYDRALARHVAVKHVLASDPMAVLRFDREARITAQLEHPGIVPIYEAGRTSAGTPYYVMRRVDGEPLLRVVEKRGLAERLALVPNVLAACDAVAFAHARGIVHRDIKPANILLGPFGETLVIDWGLACRVDDHENAAGAGTVAGTPGFMAPEQARGEALDPRADVFALGATLFFVIAGEAPHTAERGSLVVANVAADAAPAWDRLPADAPDDLRAIVAKALSRDRTERYADAGALAADLRRFITGNLVGARKYSALEQLRRWLVRHKAIVAVALASVVAIAIVAALAFSRIVAERDDANAARRRETERADQLTVEQARRLVETDPTLAVATVAPMVSRGHWREAFDIVAHAKARGVARRLPASASTRSVAVARDRKTAASIGDDGVVRRYDLVTHAVRTVAELGAKTSKGARIEIFDANALVLFVDTSVIVRDGENARTITVASPAIATAIFDDAVYWLDAEHGLWRLGRTAAAPTRIAGDADRFALAPDGQRVMYSSATGAWIVDAGGGEPVQIVEEATTSVAWDSNSTRVVATTRTKGQLLAIDVPTRETRPSATGLFVDELLFVNGDVFGQSSEGIITSLAGAQRYSGARGVGLVALRDGIVAAATSDGHITLQRGNRVHTLLAPAAVDAIAGGGSVLVGATPNALLVWNIDDVIPRRIPRGPVGIEMIAGPHHLLDLASRPLTWIDLATLGSQPGPPITGLPQPWVGHGPFARAVVRSEGVAFAIRPNTTESLEVAKQVAFAFVLDDHRVLTFQDDGAVLIYDTTTHTTSPLLPAGPAPMRAVNAGDYVVIGYPDKHHVRIHVPSGRRDELTDGPEPRTMHVTADGTLWFARDAEIRTWRIDGKVAVHATLPKPIRTFYGVDDLLVADTAEVGYFVTTTTPATTRPTIQLGITSSAARGLVVVPNVTGGAKLVDAVTGAWWPIGQLDAEAVHIAKLTPDGTAYYERHRDGFWVLPVEPPVDAAATQRMIDRLVN